MESRVQTVPLRPNSMKSSASRLTQPAFDPRRVPIGKGPLEAEEQLAEIHPANGTTRLAWPSTIDATGNPIGRARDDGVSPLSAVASRVVASSAPGATPTSVRSS